jgi:glutathione S-transferase
MSIAIFWSSGSCPSWRVLFTLELKGLPYESRLLEFSKREHKSTDMLAMNPRGKVPVLRDGDFTLYESLAIVSYLEAEYPERPVLGRTPEETGAIWRTWSECVFYVEPAIDRVCIPIYRGTAAETLDAVRTAAHDVAAELAPFEARLARTPWLAGDQPTAADAAFVPQIGHLLRATGKPVAHDLDLEVAPFTARFPAFAAWWDRCRAVPGFERTFPPHWR